MTTDDLAIPALSRQEIEATLEHLTPAQLRYLEAVQEAPSKSQACQTAGIAQATLYDWRCSIPAFKALDDTISLNQDVNCRTAIAKAILGQHAPKASLRIVELSQAPAKTDRQLQVALQASVKVLEAVGVLKQGAGVQVNVDARRIDVAARELWEKRGKRAWRGEKGPGDGKAPPEGGGEAQPQS